MKLKKIVSLVLIPHHLLFLLCFLCLNKKKKDIIYLDLKLYFREFKSEFLNFFYCLRFIPEFRALYFYRIGKIRYLIKWIHPVNINLYFYTNHIGAGLKIQHGFSTIIAAKSIGKNCWINQQVTIGYTNDTDCPEILDNVTINAGAIVIGNVVIGNNSIIGAGAVVTKNVPDNAVVVGNPARIVRLNGVRVDMKL